MNNEKMEVIVMKRLNKIKKISFATIKNWSGDDSKEEVLKYLLAIVNGEFSIVDAAREISILEDNDDEEE